MNSGVLCQLAMVVGTPQMLVWCADNWDTLATVMKAIMIGGVKLY